MKKIPGKSINFSEEEIENLSWNEYGDNTTFSILQLLYPNLDYRNKFHIDHIYPKSKFNKSYLKKQNVDFSQLLDSNYLANLQLLEGSQNLEKSNKEFKDWLEEQDFSKEERKDYFKKNYIPENIELTFRNYNEFFEEREKLLARNPKSAPCSISSAPWASRRSSVPEKSPANERQKNEALDQDLLTKTQHGQNHKI